MIMNGQTMNYKKYFEYLTTMSEPIMPSGLPKVKLDMKAIAKYAKEHKICFADMTEEEKNDILKNEDFI